MTQKRRKIAEARAARDEIMDELRLVGLQAAYRRAIKILEDDAAPVTAQAQIVRIVFGAAGLEPNAADEEDHKEPHQMTAAELEAATARALLALDRAADPEEIAESASVFD